MQQKVLITGVAGIIGSRIAKRLIDAGFNVCGIDNLTNGKMSNIPNEVNFYFGSVTDLDLLDRIFKKEKVDIVCHAAALEYNEVSDVEVNIIGAIKILNKSKKYGIKHILFASSEDSSKAESFYGICKWAAEKVLLINTEIPVTIFRLPKDKSWAKLWVECIINKSYGIKDQQYAYES